jgi:hypothetical protein
MTSKNSEYNIAVRATDVTSRMGRGKNLELHDFIAAACKIVARFSFFYICQNFATLHVQVQ